MGDIGKIIIALGVALILIGVLVTLLGKIPGLGKLPGDIVIKKENFTFYFPLATCLLISLILSALFFLWGKK